MKRCDLSTAMKTRYIIDNYTVKREPSFHPRRPDRHWRNHRLRAYRIRPLHRCRSDRWNLGIYSPIYHSLPFQVANTFVFKYGLGALRMRNKQPYGSELAILASVLLAGSSIPRAFRTGKPLPAGLSVLAVTGLVVYGWPYVQARLK